MSDAFIILIQGLCAITVILTVVDFVRHRDQVRLEIALLFVSVAVFLIALTARPSFASKLLDILIIIAGGAQPYLLLRLVRRFRQVSPVVQWAAVIGMVFTWGALLLVPQPPAWVVILSVIYFVAVGTFSTYAFVREAIQVHTVRRLRLACIALGSGLLSLSVLLAFAYGRASTQLEWLVPIGWVLLVAIAVSYYLGFAPPRRLLQLGRAVELHQFLIHLSGQPAHQRADQITQLLSVYAARMVGGVGAVVALWDESTGRLVCQPNGFNLTDAQELEVNDPECAVARVWRTHRAEAVNEPGRFGPALQEAATRLESQALLVVLIAVAEQAHGVLVVFRRRSPLFGEDDLASLQLLAEHSALVISYASALSEQQALVLQLKRGTESLQLLDRLTEILSEVRHNTRGVLRNASQQIAEQIGDECAIYLLSSNKEWLEPVAFHRRRAGEGQGAFIPLTGQAIFLPQVAAQALNNGRHIDRSAFLNRPGIGNLVIKPLLGRDQKIGALAIARDKVSRPFDEGELLFLQNAADRIALAIEDARLYEAMRDSEARLAGILNIAHDAIVSIDEHQTIIMFNQGAEQIFGYIAAEAIGRPLELLLPMQFAYIHPHHVKAFSRSEPKARRMGDRQEIRGCRKDGTEFPAEAAISKLELGHQTVYTVVLRDVTERKRIESELILLNQNLEQRVAERTAQLEQSNRELETFAQVVAHELKSPLTKIAAYSVILDLDESATLQPESRRILDQLSESAFQAGRIVDDLLLLARTRHTEVITEPIDMSEVYDRAVKRLDIQIEATGATVHRPNVWVQVLGQGAWIEEVWINYLSNALKYAGPQPKIEVGWANQGDGMIRFWVKDSGPGLSSAEQAKLFSPFMRLQPAAALGNGLGLSIVQQIVEKCGGNVGVESEMGQGSKFWFALPSLPEESALIKAPSLVEVG